MTVKELIEMLQAIPQDALVIMSKDSEGNSYAPLDGVDWENQSYIPYTDWFGDVKLTHLTPELKDRGYDEEDIAPESAAPCIVLYPR